MVLCHKLLCMHVYKGLLQCKSVCDVKPGLDPRPLLARSWNRWWLDFITFMAYRKVQIKFKTAKCYSNRCKDLFKKKKYFGFRCTLINIHVHLKNYKLKTVTWHWQLPAKHSLINFCSHISNNLLSHCLEYKKHSVTGLSPLPHHHLEQTADWNTGGQFETF